MIINGIQFCLEIKMGGITLREYFHKEKVFIHGPKGEAFTISLSNSSLRRAIVVVSMDGLCVIDGLGMQDEGLGYILEPGQHMAIDCWRFKGFQCPQLRFGHRPPGFENTMDQPVNPGVIEAVFFFEQENPHYATNWLAQSGFRLEEHTSTGWGSTRKTQVIQEQFAREENPIGRLIIQYDEKDALESIGIHTH